MSVVIMTALTVTIFNRKGTNHSQQSQKHCADEINCFVHIGYLHGKYISYKWYFVMHSTILY